MLIKIDHTVSSHIAEDRGDCVTQLTASKRMYSWHEGELVGDTIDNFAIANPKATFGDFIEWTKRTYMARLTAHKNKETFTGYSLTGDYNPTKGNDPQAKFGRHGEAAKGTTVIEDANISRPKLRTDLRKVAEPGQENAVDQADADALLRSEAALGEQKDGPGTPDFVEDNPTSPPNPATLPPVEPGQQPDVSEDPLAAFKARKF